MPEVPHTREALRISCADALELMTDHLEGALTPADAARVRAHLSGCEPCTVYLDQLRSAIRLAGETRAEVPVDPERLARLVERFRRLRDE